ncbi:MAG: alpha/beta hydrolase [Bacteroidetes bacterium]|nr:alpha/beta hydrolase [Bacteroidota bacterium]
MLNVYCIPGMGVDGRLFKNLKLNNCKIHYIKWEPASKNETLPQYAMRLAKQIDDSLPFALIGVSLGGMCAVEIAKKIKPVKTFVISSCKTFDELPSKITFWKNIPVYKVLSDSVFKRSALLIKKQFGVFTKEQKNKFKEMLNTSPQGYFVGAVNCIVNWKNKEVPQNIIHIHGTADLVLPYKNLNCDYTIQEGNHFMIVSKADEINEIINKELGLN